MKKIVSLLIALSILLTMLSVMPVQAAEVSHDEEWVLYQSENFSSSRWLVPYYSYYGNRNSTYGFAFQGYTGKQSEWNNAGKDANQFMAMPEGIEGDYVVDFDMFLDDVESLSEAALIPNYTDNFKIRVYGGGLTTSGANNKIETSLLYQNVFGWSGTLEDDNSVAYPYTKALASSKYVTAPTDGTPSWIDMRISLIGNTLEIYAKWNTASIWRKLKTYTVTAYDGARGLALVACANVGYDNFKVYQTAEQVVNETFEAGTTTYKDAISLSKTDYTKVASAGYLTLGYNQNVISTVDSYSDYIVEFDYNPYFINTAPRLVFTIGGYSFHMRGISNGISGAEGVTTGATITKKESFSFVTREWHTIRVKKVGSTFRLSAKKATDENYTLIYEGTFAEDKTEPFKMNVYDTSDVQSGHINDYQAYMDNLKIWDLSSHESSDAENEFSLCFEEKFETGLQKWSVTADSVYCHDGVLENNYNNAAKKYAQATINIPYDNMPKNPVINIRTSLNSGTWLRFILTTEDGKAADILLRQSLGLYDFTTGSENVLKYVTFDADVMYDFAIECKDYTVIVYYKKATDESYTKAGEFERKSNKAPKLQIYGYAMNFKIDEVEIYRNDITDFGILEGAIYVNAGDSVTLRCFNNTDQNIVWSVEDSAVATISDGMLNGLKKGETVVNASTEDGSYSFSVPVICLQEVESITLSHSAITIEEGEVINLSAAFAPIDVDDKTLVWESSDESVVSLFGSSRKEKTVNAVGVGCAVITAKAPFGNVVDECMVTVIPEKKNGTSSVIFSTDETKTAIEPLIFGMHCSPGKGTNDTNELYNDLGVKSLRSFLNTSSVSVEDNLDSSNTNGIPQIVALTEFPTKTVSELVDIVKEVKLNASANNILYIEMGNEVYDGTMDINDYIAKCKEFYAAVKAYDSTAKIGVVAVSQDLIDDNYTWNNNLKSDSSFYDAVIIHNYGAFYDHDNLTRKDMADSMYAWNKYMENSLYKIAEQFPGKELWVTEYGHLQFDMFKGTSSNYNEINRLQTGKSVGAALSNVEKLLDMAESGIVQISNYHYDNDSQGFGVIQAETKLPNYYTFKKVGELLNGYSNIFKMDAVKNDVKNSAYRIKNNPISSNVAVNTVECWGFGDEALRKVVIANHNNESARFSLNGYKLKKEWTYGGENAFKDYLLWDGIFTAAPKEIDVPEELSGDVFSDIVELKPYSMLVCEVIRDENMITAAFNVPNGIENVSIETDIIVTFSEDIDVDLNDYLTLTVDGTETSYSVSLLANNKYEIIPDGGLKNNASYQITVTGIDGMSDDETVTFKTKKPSLSDCFTKKIGIYDILSLGENYEITFKTSANANLSVRGIPVYLQNKTVYYSNGNEIGNNSIYSDKKLRVLGHHGFSTNSGYFKIVVLGTEINVYGKSAEEKPYEYIGTIYNVAHSSDIPTFSSKISDITIKINPNPLTGLEFSTVENGKVFYSNTMFPGENTVNIKADSTVNVIYAEYDENGAFKSLNPFTGSSEYSFTTENNGLTRKIFVWEGWNTLKPLQNTIFAY